MAIDLDIPGGSGSGDVVGPATATDNAVAIYDGTTGELLKDSGVIYDAALVSLSMRGVAAGDRSKGTITDYAYGLELNSDAVATGVDPYLGLRRAAGVGPAEAWLGMYVDTLDIATAPGSDKQIKIETGYNNGIGNSRGILLKTGFSDAADSGPITVETGSAGGTRGNFFFSVNSIHAGSCQITNLLDPTNAQDAATKNYVDLNNGDNIESVISRSWEFAGYNQVSDTTTPDLWYGGVSNAGGGASANNNVAGGFMYDNTSAGIMRLRTGTGTAGGAFGTTGNWLNCAVGAGSVKFRFLLPAVSDATDTYTAVIGLGDLFTTSVAITNGVFLRYTHGASAGNFELRTVKAGASTTVDSAVAAVAGTWYIVTIDWNSAADEVGISINGSARVTSSTNIPNTTANACGPYAAIVKSAGTNNRDLIVDWAKIYVVRD